MEGRKPWRPSRALPVQAGQNFTFNLAVRSGPLLPPSHSTDFADTEMPGSDGQSTALSTTQYGELN